MWAFVLLGLICLAVGHEQNVSDICPRDEELIKKVPMSENFSPHMILPIPHFDTVYVSHRQFPDGGLPKRMQGVTYSQSALGMANSKFPAANFTLTDHYVGTNGMAHVYFAPMSYNDYPIRNYDFQVNLDPHGHIFSYGYTFAKVGFLHVPVTEIKDFISALEAVKKVTQELELPVEHNSAKLKSHDLVRKLRLRTGTVPDAYNVTGMDGVYDEPRVQFAYWGLPDGTVIPTWEVRIRTHGSSHIAYVNAVTNEMVSAIDQVAHADATSFKVNRLSTTDPTKGPRTVVEDPWDDSVSDQGWLLGGKSKTTIGNNVYAQSVNCRKGIDKHKKCVGRKAWRPTKQDSGFEFDYQTENGDKDRGAAVTQIFYAINKAHDIFYKLGFIEAAGNFQTDNFGKGGRGADAISVDIHHPGMKGNGGYFHTKDGVPARIEFGINSRVQPHRDGAFDMDLIIHEYTHGLSNRLTGGPSTEMCTIARETRGLGEGWSDFVAIALGLNSTSKHQKKFRPFLAWFTDKPNGARSFPYSTNCTTNPVTFEDLDYLDGKSQGAFYEIGTFFANILLDMMWRLIDKHGIHDDEYPEFHQGTIIPIDGRYLALRLVMDAMALQPCNPTLIQARDAILDADTILTGGDHHCEIWSAFAKRHVGKDAENGGAQYFFPVTPKTSHEGFKPRKGDTTVPKGVCKRRRQH